MAPKYSELDWKTVGEDLHEMVTDMEVLDRFLTPNVRVLARGLELVMQRLEELAPEKRG